MTSKILWRLHVSNQVGSVVTNKVTTDPSWFVSLRSLHSQGIQSRAHAEEKLDTSACRMFFVSCCFIIFMVIILCCQALAALTCLHMSRSTLAGKKKDLRDGILRDRSFFVMIVICIRVRWFLLFFWDVAVFRHHMGVLSLSRQVLVSSMRVPVWHHRGAGS